MQSIRTIEMTGYIENHHLILDEQLPLEHIGKVKVLIFLPEINEVKEKSGHWRDFFENPTYPTEDFMVERIDLPLQNREMF